MLKSSSKEYLRQEPSEPENRNRTLQYNKGAGGSNSLYPQWIREKFTAGVALLKYCSQESRAFEEQEWK